MTINTITLQLNSTDVLTIPGICNCFPLPRKTTDVIGPVRQRHCTSYSPLIEFHLPFQNRNDHLHAERRSEALKIETQSQTQLSHWLLSSNSLPVKVLGMRMQQPRTAELHMRVNNSAFDRGSLMVLVVSFRLLSKGQLISPPAPSHQISIARNISFRFTALV